MSALLESIVEEAVLTWFGELGYAVGHGPRLAPGEAAAERDSFGDVVLVGRLRTAIRLLNPAIPEEAWDEAFRKVLHVGLPGLATTNRAFHRLLRDGVDVEYRRADGSIAGDRVRLVDFADPDANDWLAVNQLTVIEGGHNRRADVVVFVNGLPLALFELKNAADEGATIWSAFAQVQTYKGEIPSLLHYNELLVLSDGVQARIGSLTASQEWFKVWRTIDGTTDAPKTALELEVLIRGVFEKRRFLDLIQHFITFEEDPDSDRLNKIIAGYHQFHAVNTAVQETLRASGMSEVGGAWRESKGASWARSMAGGKTGDRRAGVVWHTQGSGKSLSMLFYASRIIRHPAMRNPTLVVLTDRNDLDDQLFGQFQRCHEMLGQTPVQAESRDHLRKLLAVASGGVVFTTIQKFMPMTAPSPRPSPRGRGGSMTAPSPQPSPRGRGGSMTAPSPQPSPRGRGGIMTAPSPQPSPRGRGGSMTAPSPEQSPGESGGRGGEGHYRGGYDFAGLAKRAVKLREQQTPAEGMLWELLRNRQLAGAKFRRQHQFGDYICDFFCAEARVVVECDGEVHQTPERQKIDRKRDAYLQSQGLVVLRFPNERVVRDPVSVLREISGHLPSTHGRGAGGEGGALSERQNIVVITDEAHRSQYDMIDGFARHMRDALPNASFIGFTGTPIEKTDANTRAVFGEYISIYDIQRAVADKATVPIYYESRIAKLGLNAAALPKLDEEFEEITEGEEPTTREKLKTKWAALEALVGDPKRVKLIAADLVQHFERRWEAMDGKAMIVCMSRRICADLYDALIALRPGWAGAKDDDGEAEAKRDCVVKVVMTGGADDGPAWQPHIRNKEKRRKLATRFKDAKDPFRIVIVRDMWLTGFDAPCLHTMYADKPMRGHGLMQAIARVNRVFRDKPGGLVVDYLGLADQLKYALATYTESGGQGTPSIDTAQAVAVMLEKYEIACDMLHGFNWSKWTTGTPVQRLALLPAGQQHILEQDDGKQRFVQVVSDLSRAFALCAAQDEAIRIRDDISFFQAVQAALSKQGGNGRKSPDQIDAAVRQLVAKAIVTEGGIIDIFTAAGLKKPDISILSDQFLAEVRGLKHRNVAAELLEKLLKDELKLRAKRNLVQSELFSEKLKKTLNAYHNRAIATQEVIEELIRLAKEMSAANQRGVDMGLTDDEIAFYDALAANESAIKAMGIPELKVIAAELVTSVRKSVTIDWTLRESARAKIRVMVKRILRKHGYPPDLQDEATQTVLKQAELLCAEWAT